MRLATRAAVPSAVPLCHCCPLVPPPDARSWALRGCPESDADLQPAPTRRLPCHRAAPGMNDGGRPE